MLLAGFLETMAVNDVWFFERVAPIYDMVMPPANAAELQPGLDQVSGTISRVLDVGGGTGRAIKELDTETPIVLDAAEKMLKRIPAGIARVRSDARTIPVKTESIDAVLIVDAYHHLPQPQRVLTEVSRVIRPGGVVLIREFDPTTFRGRLLRTGESVIGLNSHFHQPSSLRNSMANAGLETSLIATGFPYTVVGKKPGR